MSVPASMIPQVLSSMTTISPIDALLNIFNTNPYFIGIMMLILNIGGRFISLEVTKKQEQFLQQPWVRRILIFTVLFVATRNIWVAFWTTITVVLFLGYLFNENSSLCIFGTGGVSGSQCSAKPNTLPGEEMTPEEKEILQRLSAKAQRYQNSSNSKLSNSSKNAQQIALDKSVLNKSIHLLHDDTASNDTVEINDIYNANVTLLKNIK
jgi:hypothetical protein